MVTRPAFPEVQWNRPWLEPFATLGTEIADSAKWRDALNAAACRSSTVSESGNGIRFVPQAFLPKGTAYESHIFATGQVPTRDNLHDFFNALVWLTFPLLKRRLNRLQANALLEQVSMPTSVEATHGTGRGAVRDAATLFDESGAIFISSEPKITAAWHRRDWSSLFVENRSGFGRCWSVCLFGHALMEKLVDPFKSITAHAVTMEVTDQYFFTLPVAHRLAILDRRVSESFANTVDKKTFNPLPLAGLPGWFENQDAAFYADRRVFRPLR